MKSPTFLFNSLIIIISLISNHTLTSQTSSIHVYIQDQLINILRNTYYPIVMSNLRASKIKDFTTTQKTCSVAVKDFVVDIPSIPTVVTTGKIMTTTLNDSEQLTLELDRINQKLIVTVKDFVVHPSAKILIFCYPLIGARNAKFEGAVNFQKITITLSPDEIQRQSDGFFFPTFNIDSIDIKHSPIITHLQIQDIPSWLTEFINTQIIQPKLEGLVKNFKGDVNDALQKTLKQLAEKTHISQEIDKTGVLLCYSGAGRLQIYDNYVRQGIFMTFALKPDTHNFIQTTPYIPSSYTGKFLHHSRNSLNSIKVVVSDYLFDAFVYACQLSNTCYFEADNKFLKDRDIKHYLSTYDLFFISKNINIKKQDSRDLILRISVVENKQRQSLKFHHRAIVGQMDFILTFLYDDDKDKNDDQKQLAIEFKAGIDINIDITSVKGDDQKMAFLQIKDFQLGLNDLQLRDYDKSLGQFDDEEMQRFKKVTKTLFYLGTPILHDLIYKKKLPLAKKMIDIIQFEKLKLLFVDQVAIFSTQIKAG